MRRLYYRKRVSLLIYNAVLSGQKPRRFRTHCFHTARVMQDCSLQEDDFGYLFLSVGWHLTVSAICTTNSSFLWHCFILQKREEKEWHQVVSAVPLEHLVITERRFVKEENCSWHFSAKNLQKTRQGPHVSGMSTPSTSRKA